MRTPLTLALLLTTSVFATGCKKDEPAPQPSKTQAAQAEPVAPAPVKAPPLAPDEPTTTTSGIATPEDFEEEAEKTVAVDNLETELDRLEAEISIGF